MLTNGQLAAFRREGFVHVPALVPRPVIDACADALWEITEPWGVLRDDVSTWKYPVLRFECPSTPATQAAWRALWPYFDQLIGPGQWVKRPDLGGTVPIRLPSDEDPNDTGWHVEGSFLPDGAAPWDWHTNAASRGRALLALVLITDVTERDAPTRIRIGSHADLGELLGPYGDSGCGSGALSPLVEAASAGRPVVNATGRAGDVFFCHPFLVHAASWPHRGSSARMLAQPGVEPVDGWSLASLAGEAATKRKGRSS